MEETTGIPERPPSIYLASFWSFARSLAAVLSLIGAYRLYQQFAPALGGVREGGAPFIAWAFSALGVAIAIPAAIGGVVFFYLGVGIFLGHGWARTGFLWMSVAVLVWNLRSLASAQVGLVLWSLLWLSIALWYYRRPSVLHFFGARDKLPGWLGKRVGGVPLDFALALCIGAVVIALEGYGLIQLFRAVPTASLPGEPLAIASPGETATILLEPQAVSAVDQDAMELARAVLQKRLDSTLAHKAQASANGELITVLVAETDREIAARLASELGKIEFLGSPQPAAVESNYTGGYDPILTQASVSSAVAEEIQWGAQGWQVSLSLDPDGTDMMAAYTSSHLGSYFTIVEDGQVVLSARIESPILDGKGVIYGTLTEMDAKILAAKLTSGPMPFQLVEAGPP